MTYKEFAKQLKANSLCGAYLAYGEEEYLKQEYVDKLDAFLPAGLEILNKTVLESADVQDIYDAAIIAPFMCEKRIVIAKDPLFIKAGKGDDSLTGKSPSEESDTDKVRNSSADLLLSDSLSSTIIIIYVRGNVDKRKKIFKQFESVSRTVEFPLLNEDELCSWIEIKVKKDGGSITPNAVRALIHSVGLGINAVLPELSKLISYRKNEIIDVPDVEALVSKSVEASVFTMIDCLFSNNRQKAYALLEDMLLSNEEPLMIINLISRQLRMLTYAKSLLSQGVSRTEIQSRLEIKTFTATKLFETCSKLQMQWLAKAYIKSIETDFLIKSGKIGERQGLDEIIALLATK
ncbi:MAG: DNA polymerase III subunit delta [Clostridiales bacterium]|nr:DNA polymerase III subunit delta [Clostridiales bacterium]